MILRRLGRALRRGRARWRPSVLVRGGMWVAREVAETAVSV